MNFFGRGLSLFSCGWPVVVWYLFGVISVFDSASPVDAVTMTTKDRKIAAEDKENGVTGGNLDFGLPSVFGTADAAEEAAAEATEVVEIDDGTDPPEEARESSEGNGGGAVPPGGNGYAKYIQVLRRKKSKTPNENRQCYAAFVSDYADNELDMVANVIKSADDSSSDPSSVGLTFDEMKERTKAIESGLNALWEGYNEQGKNLAEEKYHIAGVAIMGNDSVCTMMNHYNDIVMFLIDAAVFLGVELTAAPGVTKSMQHVYRKYSSCFSSLCPLPVNFLTGISSGFARAEFMTETIPDRQDHLKTFRDPDDPAGTTYHVRGNFFGRTAATMDHAVIEKIAMDTCTSEDTGRFAASDVFPAVLERLTASYDGIHHGTKDAAGPAGGLIALLITSAICALGADFAEEGAAFLTSLKNQGSLVCGKRAEGWASKDYLEEGIDWFGLLVFGFPREDWHLSVRVLFRCSCGFRSFFVFRIAFSHFLSLIGFLT